MATKKTRRSQRSTRTTKKAPVRRPRSKKTAAARKKTAARKNQPARKATKAGAKTARVKRAKQSARVAKKVTAPNARAAKKTVTPGARAAKKTAVPSARKVPGVAPKRAPAAPAREAGARRVPTPAPVDVSLFPCGDAAVRAATGKTWSEWLELLDAAGAAKQAFDHQRIWEIAMQALPESAGWWGQMVSVGYERARGLREKNQGSSGAFQSTSAKTLAVPLFAAFAAWADAGLRGNWLEAPGLDFTKLNVGRNIRARWPDGTLLDIRFTDAGPDKCQVVVDTMKLGDAEAVQKAKAFWQAQLERLQAYLRV